MTIQIYSEGVLFPGTDVYVINGFGTKNFTGITNTFGINVFADIVADLASFTFPLPAEYLYVCNWVSCFNLVSASPPVDGSFPGNPIRKKYGFYAIQRNGMVLMDDRIRYDTQVTEKFSFMFGNSTDTLAGFGFPDLSPPALVTRYFGTGLDQFAGVSAGNNDISRGAASITGVFVPGTLWDIQIQYNLSVVLVSPNSALSYVGIIL